MIAIEIYEYVPAIGDEYIGSAYSAEQLYDVVQSYWKASEYNQGVPLILHYVNKRKNLEESDRDYKDWEADQQYKWFVEGDDNELFEN